MLMRLVFSPKISLPNSSEEDPLRWCSIETTELPSVRFSKVDLQAGFRCFGIDSIGLRYASISGCSLPSVGFPFDFCAPSLPSFHQLLYEHRLATSVLAVL